MININGSVALATTRGLTLGLALTLTLASVQDADAQQQGDGARSVLEEVIVTARKREESVQDIPLSVSAISAETIERAGIDDLESVADFTAGLIYQDFGGGGLGSPVIRGQAQTDIRSVESNVGVFVDGVFVTSRGNLEFGLLDMERVEVVKGPQSALYGNNTFAGAINYVSKRPTEELSGKLSTTVGDAGRFDISGALSGTLVEDVLRGRIAGGYSEFDGTVDNSIGGDLGGYDEKYAVSVQLDYTPTDNFEARAYLYYGAGSMDPTAGFIYLNNCGGFNSLQSDTTTGRGGTIFRYFCGDMFAPDQVTVREDLTFGNETTSLLAYVSLGWDITDKLSLSSLSSIGDYESDAVVEFFYNAPLDIPPELQQLLIPDFGGSEDWSQELRLDYAGDGRFDWTAGVYLNSFDVDRNFGVGFPANPRQIVNRDTLTESELWAVFAGTDYTISDTINLRLEGRYQSDQRDVRLINANAGTETPLSDTFDDTTFRASLDFGVADNVMLYTSIAQGTKSGGFNNTPLESEQTFDPEENLVYEVGIKSTLLDGALQLNATVFYAEWSDAQITTPSQVPGNTNVTRNVGNVTTPGGEIDLSWAVNDNWLLTAGYGYSDPTFDSGTVDIQHGRRCDTPEDCGLTAGPGGIGIDVSGQRVDRSVQHTAYLSSTFSWSVNDYDFYFRADGSHTGDQPQRSLNLQFVPSRTLVNARTAVITPNGWEFALWARNLFDEEYIYSAVNQPERVPSSTFSTGHVANGRTFGITGTFNF